jgi:hypothetical protein
MGQKEIYFPLLREVGLWPSAGQRKPILSAPSGS